MKQFFTIFKFELNNYFKNKVFIGFTIAFVILLGIGLSFPRIMDTFKEDTGKTSQEEKMDKMAINDVSGADKTLTFAFFQQALGTQYQLKLVDKSETELKKAVKNGDYKAAVIVTSPLSYKYIANTVSITDTVSYTVDEIMAQRYRYFALTQAGLDQNQAQSILSAQVKGETIVTGKDQTQSFFYTYIVIFALYFALILYGQFVSQSVANEKSTRAMELLITSAKPVNLMFGKVLGSGIAGLLQLVIMLFSAFGFYTLNKDAWGDNEIVKSVFDMPVELLLYTILFFILGFFIYAFMYGALGSLATRAEDLNTLVLPVTFIFIIAFVIVMTSMGSGNVDSTLMVACSYIPFTSPMAMFARIAMGDVKPLEIIISVAILVVSTVGIGYISAAIYKAGVLMYGNAPKFSDIAKIFKKEKAQ